MLPPSAMIDRTTSDLPCKNLPCGCCPDREPKPPKMSIILENHTCAIFSCHKLSSLEKSYKKVEHALFSRLESDCLHHCRQGGCSYPVIKNRGTRTGVGGGRRRDENNPVRDIASVLPHSITVSFLSTPRCPKKQPRRFYLFLNWQLGVTSESGRERFG